jgi:hypothetical protein
MTVPPALAEAMPMSASASAPIIVEQADKETAAAATRVRRTDLFIEFLLMRQRRSAALRSYEAREERDAPARCSVGPPWCLRGG